MMNQPILSCFDKFQVGCIFIPGFQNFLTLYSAVDTSSKAISVSGVTSSKGISVFGDTSSKGISPVNLKIMEHNINYETTTTAGIQSENIYSSSSNDYCIYNNDSPTASS